MNELAVSNIDSVAEEIQALLTEAEFASRMIVIEAYHQAGKLVLGLPGEVSDNVKRVAEKIGKSERMVYYAVKFAQTYKTADDIPEGKNVSMRKIIREYLTTPKEKAEHIHTPITICSGCKERLDQ